jgi:hypothetical protein
MWIREPMHLSTSSNGSSVEPDIAPARLLRGPARSEPGTTRSGVDLVNCPCPAAKHRLGTADTEELQHAGRRARRAGQGGI